MQFSQTHPHSPYSPPLLISHKRPGKSHCQLIGGAVRRKVLGPAFPRDAFAAGGEAQTKAVVLTTTLGFDSVALCCCAKRPSLSHTAALRSCSCADTTMPQALQLAIVHIVMTASLSTGRYAPVVAERVLVLGCIPEPQCCQ